ncbi:hypothetical protein, partial [Anaerotignum sp.]
QYRDQYIREGQRAMKDTMAQTAAMTGGYGSTYGAIAAQQDYDNYLAGLNDRVPQLEQMAYGKYADNLADMYNQLGAYQGEEQRLYGQYLDQMDQYNIDRDYAFNAMQAALAQNNQENQFNRGIFESDRDFNLQRGQIDLENALAIGDIDKIAAAGYDTTSLKLQQALQDLQARTAMGKLQGAVAGGSGGTSGGTSGGSKTKKESTEQSAQKAGYSSNDAYARLMAEYMKFGDTMAFDGAVRALLSKGVITESDYNKFAKQFG